MTQTATDSTNITATLVSCDQRMQFLPTLFGKHYFKGEMMVYTYMRKLAAQYNGGFWQFYRLSNGGGYLAPELGQSLRVVGPGNWFDQYVSTEAAGIIATLYALSELANSTMDDTVIDQYHLLRDYIGDHPEGASIYAAIN